MRARVLFLATLFLLVGIAVNVRGAAISDIHSQRWLEDHTPTVVGRFATVPGVDGTRETYKVADNLAEALHAAGLVARVMSNGKDQYDVVAITSDRGESFHDPAACFRSQGWNPSNQAVTTLHTEGHGDLQVQTLTITGSDRVARSAVYCFRLNDQIYPTQTGLIGRMMWGQLSSGRGQEGYMYRFIDLSGSGGPTALREFVTAYLNKTLGKVQG